MKTLGRGWQYTTYDVGNGRVLKKYNSAFTAYMVMAKDCFPFLGYPPWKFPGFHKRCKETARDSMRKVKNSLLEPWMMGNPKVLNELDYEQDKLRPLYNHLCSVSTEEGKRIVDAFVKFNAILVERKLIDKSFNITKNFGLDKENRIVLMDLGELYSSDAAIEGQRRKRAWAPDYVVDWVKDKEVREYYIREMDKRFNLN